MLVITESTTVSLRGIFRKFYNLVADFGKFVEEFEFSDVFVDRFFWFFCLKAKVFDHVFVFILILDSDELFKF